MESAFTRFLSMMVVISVIANLDGIAEVLLKYGNVPKMISRLIIVVMTALAVNYIYRDRID